MSLIGLGLQWAYRLRHHFFLGWPLSRWLGLALFVLSVWAFFRWLLNYVPAIAMATVWLAFVLSMGWATRRGYVHFRPLNDGRSVLRQAAPPPPLGKLELVPTRASGWFAVEGQRGYYVDVDADFETAGTREHIVLGRLHPSRYLLLGTWPGYELGWWYIFFQPAAIRSLSLGTLHFGLQPRVALRVIYLQRKEKEEKLENAFFTFSDTAALRRVWDDLVLDAPREAVPGHLKEYGDD